MPKFKTTNIKGKDYVEVHERVRAYWEMYPKGRILTEIIHFDLKEGNVIIKASVYDSEGNIKGDGHAHEFQADKTSMVNKTSFIENCETSAIGRACATAGILVEYGMASSDEVQAAIKLGKEMDVAKLKKAVSEVSSDAEFPRELKEATARAVKKDMSRREAEDKKPSMEFTTVADAKPDQLESILGKKSPALTAGSTVNAELIALNVKAMKVTDAVTGKAVSDEYREMLAFHGDANLPKALCALVLASLTAANDKITRDKMAA